MKMNSGTARLVLNLQHSLADLTEEIVVTAWRVAVKQHHPDTAELRAFEALPSVAPIVTIDVLTSAKEFLLSHLNGDDLACKACSGRGKVPAQMGWRACSVCKGSGDKR